MTSLLQLPDNIIQNLNIIRYTLVKVHLKNSYITTLPTFINQTKVSISQSNCNESKKQSCAYHIYLPLELRCKTLYCSIVSESRSMAFPILIYR